MKNTYLRMAIYFAIGFVIAFAIIFWTRTHHAQSDEEAVVAIDYVAALDGVLESCSKERAAELRAMVEALPEAAQQDAAYLIVNMPEADLAALPVALLKENVEYARKVRETYAWTKALPEDIYRNEVLPYFVVDEVRDSWRPTLNALFAPLVADCKSLEEAISAVNANIPRITGVDYNTLREKTNQSPAESMRQGMASCTGLSILLVDAFRSVGIPARFVGTLSWHDNRGNHSWTEVWLDGKWRVTEYYFPSKLDHLWFMPDASKANAEDRMYAIYATKFGKADDWFPMIWAAEDEYNPMPTMPRNYGAENVTERYIDLANEQYTRHIEAGTHTFIRISGYADSRHTEHSGDRVAMGVDIFCGSEQMGGGLTAGPLRDMNDVFLVLVPKNAEYELRYYNAAGELQTMKVALGEEPVTVAIYQK